MTDHDPTTAEPQLPIFTYGTLRSGESAEELIVRDVARRVPGRARGRLLPLNASYPAAVFPPEASSYVDGELVWLKSAAYPAALDRIDQYENVPFLFRRIAVMVEAEGQEIRAWAYTYTHASHDIRPQKE